MAWPPASGTCCEPRWKSVTFDLSWDRQQVDHIPPECFILLRVITLEYPVAKAELPLASPWAQEAHIKEVVPVTMSGRLSHLQEDGGPSRVMSQLPHFLSRVGGSNLRPDTPRPCLAPDSPLDATDMPGYGSGRSLPMTIQSNSAGPGLWNRRSVSSFLRSGSSGSGFSRPTSSFHWSHLPQASKIPGLLRQLSATFQCQAAPAGNDRLWENPRWSTPDPFVTITPHSRLIEIDLHHLWLPFYRQMAVANSISETIVHIRLTNLQERQLRGFEARLPTERYRGDTTTTLRRQTPPLRQALLHPNTQTTSSLSYLGKD